MGILSIFSVKNMKFSICLGVIVLGCSLISSATTFDRSTRLLDSTKAVRSIADAALSVKSANLQAGDYADTKRRDHLQSDSAH